MAALATYKDLCIDSADVDTSARFWAATLGLEVQRRTDAVWLTGPSEQHTVWINAVGEPTSVKNRVHLDVHAGSVAEIERLGARVQRTLPRWTVLTDPDGQEFCVFVREQVPDYRFYELVVDCVDARASAEWWAGVFGVEAQHEDPAPGEDDDWWIVPPRAPFDGFVFGAVDELKTVKNRVHWDVLAESPDVLLEAGATLVRARDETIAWHVLADPEGNEFCVFDD